MQMVQNNIGMVIAEFLWIPLLVVSAILANKRKRIFLLPMTIAILSMGMGAFSVASSLFLNLGVPRSIAWVSVVLMPLLMLAAGFFVGWGMYRDLVNDRKGHTLSAKTEEKK